jgi:hypothetical protein
MLFCGRFGGPGQFNELTILGPPDEMGHEKLL